MARSAEEFISSLEHRYGAEFYDKVRSWELEIRAEERNNLVSFADAADDLLEGVIIRERAKLCRAMEMAWLLGVQAGREDRVNVSCWRADRKHVLRELGVESKREQRGTPGTD